MLKYLIASGSFKDICNSLESCKKIQALLPPNINSEICPFCDGGEYTLDIIKYYLDCNVRVVKGVYNPYLIKKDIRYLTYKNEAFIVSSEIIKLNPDEDMHKNPLDLTDYGLGQLFLDAYNKGFRKINLCLGGSSTTCFGMGFLQAIGAQIYVGGTKKTTPIISRDIPNITKIDFDNKLNDVEINVINDGDVDAEQMSYATRLKIGDTFKYQTEQIMQTIDIVLKSALRLRNCTLHERYSGVGGAIYFALKSFDNVTFKQGADYFSKLFNIDNIIKNYDVIITGEGRFDRPEWKKTPVKIASIARKYSKKVIFMCGQVTKELFPEIPENNIIQNNDILKSFNIDTLITCQNELDKVTFFKSYRDRIDFYKRITPKIFKKALYEVIER